MTSTQKFKREPVPAFDADKVSSERDGVDYINIDDRARSQLGRWLASFTRAQFSHPLYGPFRTMVGFEQWLRTGRGKPSNDGLRWAAGKDVRSIVANMESKFYPHFQEDVKMGHWLKIEQNSNIKQALKESILPFESHYYWGQMVMAGLDKRQPIADRRRDYIIDLMNEIRFHVKQDTEPRWVRLSMERYQQTITDGDSSVAPSEDKAD